MIAYMPNSDSIFTEQAAPLVLYCKINYVRNKMTYITNPYEGHLPSIPSLSPSLNLGINQFQKSLGTPSLSRLATKIRIPQKVRQTHVQGQKDLPRDT